MKLYIDISNYVSTRAHTGIQRVVREFLYHLINDSRNKNYSIVYYDTKENTFILLTDSEVLSFLKDTKYYIFQNISKRISISNIKDMDIFYDMDGAWGHSLKRTYLYKKLKKQNVYIVNFIYDMVPIVKPEFAHENTVVNFTTFIYAVYTYSDLVLFDSRSAEKDFLDVKEIIKSTHEISTRVVKLGSDIQSQLHKSTSKYKELLQSKYILFVGTLEPRKNQALMLEVFEKLEQKYSDIKLIFIGREGWNNDALVQKIRVHTLLNKKLFWLENVNDAELYQFYENAYLCTYLSEYEGFGLPIAESLSHGKITITSDNSSMYEVGKDFADYLTYNTFNELYEIIDLYLKSEKLYLAKLEFITKGYIPYTWELMYNSTINILNSIQNTNAITHIKKLQFIIISIDKENLIGTIKAIDTYISFVKEFIIITSSSLVDEFQTLTSKHKITIVDERNILKQYSKNFQNRDHVSKNWLLRTSLLNLPSLDQEFIMLDDDNRPLKNIELEHFINDHKYNAYYFYDLLKWHNYQTDYDIGQHNMKKVLDQDGYELLSYSSHKPQIINKKILKEVVDKYFEIGLETAIDEWSIYFNYAISNYPYLFNKIKYDTLNWPGNPSDWNMQCIPKKYSFENFYSSLYASGIYKDMSNASCEEKIILKEKQLIPYIANKNHTIEMSKVYNEYNMVHGAMLFASGDKKVFIFNLPYYIEASSGSWGKIPLNYKAVACQMSDIKLMYFINNNEGAYTLLPTENNYEENRIDFAISYTSLQVGTYDLLIDIVIDGKATYGTNSPYMVKLKIRGDK